MDFGTLSPTCPFMLKKGPNMRQKGALCEHDLNDQVKHLIIKLLSIPLITSGKLTNFD